MGKPKVNMTDELKRRIAEKDAQAEEYYQCLIECKAQAAAYRSILEEAKRRGKESARQNTGG